MDLNSFDDSTIRLALKSAWEKRQQDEARRRTSGSECLSEFEARSRLRGVANEKVSQRDREKIAYSLHMEIDRLETNPHLTRRTFSKRELLTSP